MDFRDWTVITTETNAIPWRITTKNRTHIDFTSESEKEWRGPFYFIQGADCKFGFISRELKESKKISWEKEIELSELAITQINSIRPKPKFFVICGDFCDAFAEKEPQLREDQERDFKRIFSKLDPEIPLVCVCGNHDVGDNPTVQTISRYRTIYGDDYFSFWAGGIFFIAINSQFYYNPGTVSELASEQDKWLYTQLDVASSSKHPVIMFQHIPWFLTNPYTKNVNYFEINYNLRKRMMNMFIEAGIRYVFCGHYHRNAEGVYNQLEVVTTSAIGGQLGKDEPGMRIVKVLADKVQHKYFTLENFPKNLELD